MGKFYVTTAIDYVNASPHIGHALEKVQADVMARYHRLKCDDVFFLTGTDEHGMKLFRAAQKENVSPQEFCDLMSARFVELTKALNLSNDYFIRTTSKRHIKAVQKLWLACKKDIYLSTYRGYYCVGCEAYLLERDLVNGKCPIHGTKPEVIEETNYFFALSRYQEALLSHFEEHPDFVVPESRYNEIYSFIKSGLEDISISRSKEKLIWGIEVPDDPAQIMYVWFDALTNYISAIGYEDDQKMFERYWPYNVHVIGKDISRFHAVLWPAMLMSAGVPVPKKIFVHGFLTVEGEKMSKSRGNVVDPIEIVKKYGADPLRYYLIREIPTTEDGDFSQRRFEERYNFDLANDLGNLLHRNLKLFVNYLQGRVEKRTDFTDIDSELIEEIKKAVLSYREKMDRLELGEGLKVVMDIVGMLNKYVDNTSPWRLASSDKERFETVMYLISEGLRIISILIQPFMPETAEKIQFHLGIDEPLFSISDAEKIGVVEGREVRPGKPLFPRISS